VPPQGRSFGNARLQQGDFSFCMSQSSDQLRKEHAMTQTAHTPGPWRVFDAFTDLEIVTDRPTANETESIVQFKGQPNANANARLMAAAPELFDALEDFFNIMHDYQSSVRKGYVTHAMDMARAAIAKAKGGAA
jgi:hypothetical protein